MPPQLDISANRKARKWTRSELLRRAAWDVLSRPLFAWTPRQLWGWRRFLLRLFGAGVGQDVHIHPSVRITIPWNLRIGDDSAIGDGAILYALGTITIGARVTVSQGAHLCAGTHDWRGGAMALEKPPITVGDEAWICADAFVGPNVTIGQRSIVGARAVAMRDIPDHAIAAGNPAKVVSWRDNKGIEN